MRLCFARLYLLSLHLAVICNGEENIAENLDAEIAYNVPGEQQPISFASMGSEHTTAGFVVYCPCMGRFGNQAEQFMGSLAFAKGLNRTLILPPWIVYPSNKIGGSDRVPFDHWFLVKPLEDYHKIVTMETFMKNIAPSVWPPGKRIGFCYSFSDDKCRMKEGNPFGPFWDHFNINFDDYREHRGLLWDADQQWVRDGWNDRFPTSDYPVIALMGAPGSFPIKEEHTWLQKYVHWSARIEKEAKKFITNVLKDEPFLAIHLRNGIDFERACEHVKDSSMNSFFASPQCIPAGSKRKLTHEMCFPSHTEVLRKVKKVVNKTKVRRVFVATDNDPMTKELTGALKSLKVSVHKRDSLDEINDPIVELAVLTMADQFIGNCVSSFTSFATRYRAVNGKATLFWAFNDEK